MGSTTRVSVLYGAPSHIGLWDDLVKSGGLFKMSKSLGWADTPPRRAISTGLAKG